MKSLLILLFITSCAGQELSQSRLIKSKLVNTYQVGIKCPINTYYNLDTKLCHYSPFKPIIKPNKPVSRKTKAIDCKAVFKAVNQCMGGK
jgi:hypothetical protein